MGNGLSMFEQYKFKPFRENRLQKTIHRIWACWYSISFPMQIWVLGKSWIFNCLGKKCSSLKQDNFPTTVKWKNCFFWGLLGCPPHKCPPQVPPASGPFPMQILASGKTSHQVHQYKFFLGCVVGVPSSISCRNRCIEYGWISYICWYNDCLDS